MVIVKLQGGLGNQLFQYAAGLSLARHHQVPVKVDVTDLRAPDEKIGTMRHYELDKIVQPPMIATQAEVDGMVAEPFLVKYYRKSLPPYKRKIYKEASFRFDEHFFKSRSNVYVKGYRQSEKYFEPIRDEVASNLFLQQDNYKNVFEFGEKLKLIDSVSLHIRRGDYLNSIVQEYHGVLDEAYYQKAINRIVDSLPDAQLFIFSDNPEWVKQQLTFTRPVQLVSGAISTNHYEDFYLMSCCRNNIIANSSFSWWAAWFNKNENKKVIAPKNWFNKANLDTSDLIPPNWLRI
jgi:hypothetical protein